QEQPLERLHRDAQVLGGAGVEVVVDEVQPGEGAGEDADVSQEGALEQQEEDEGQEPAPDLEALAEAEEGGDEEGDGEAGEGAAVDAEQGVAGGVQGQAADDEAGEQDQAEVDALEQVFGLE